MRRPLPMTERVPESADVGAPHQALRAERVALQAARRTSPAPGLPNRLLNRRRRTIVTVACPVHGSAVCGSIEQRHGGDNTSQIV